MGVHLCWGGQHTTGRARACTHTPAQAAARRPRTPGGAPRGCRLQARAPLRGWGRGLLRRGARPGPRCGASRGCWRFGGRRARRPRLRPSRARARRIQFPICQASPGLSLTPLPSVQAPRNADCFWTGSHGLGSLARPRDGRERRFCGVSGCEHHSHPVSGAAGLRQQAWPVLRDRVALSVGRPLAPAERQPGLPLLRDGGGGPLLRRRRRPWLKRRRGRHPVRHSSPGPQVRWRPLPGRPGRPARPNGCTCTSHHYGGAGSPSGAVSARACCSQSRRSTRRATSQFGARRLSQMPTLTLLTLLTLLAPPRDEAHFKAMVMARAIVNARMWAAQA